ncbi:hypothetical protein [Clostridium hydrogeniformans]|uniref:hypothetical protein n=1 Tax=Clostridium hydrogeniformans TaxID=349933 RepID=UPI0004862663|nr:hypothetical protein [Clostridium hydrogeniformans]
MHNKLLARYFSISFISGVIALITKFIYEVYLYRDSLDSSFISYSFPKVLCIISIVCLLSFFNIFARESLSHSRILVYTLLTIVGLFLYDFYFNNGIIFDLRSLSALIFGGIISFLCSSYILNKYRDF